MVKRVCLVIGYGQSNENGTGIAPNKISGAAILPSIPGPNVRHRTLFGHPDAGLIANGTPGTVGTSSMFSLLKEAIAARTGWEVMVINCARGNTGAVDAWVGRDGTTGLLKNQGDSGYDPFTWIDKLVGSVALAVSQGYEVWTIDQGHQKDVELGRPVDQIIAASAHIQSRCIAVGASGIWIGRGNRYLGGSYEAQYDAGGLIHQIADGLLAAIPGALAGADLTANTDANLRANDNFPRIHLNHAGTCWAAGKWLDAMIAAGKI